MDSMDHTVDPLGVYLELEEMEREKLTRVQSLKLESQRENGRVMNRQSSSQSNFSIHSLTSIGERLTSGAQHITAALRESGAVIRETSVAFRESSVRRISESKKLLGQGIVCISHLSEDQYWFGEEACNEARSYVKDKTYKHYPTIDEEYDPRYPGAHLALPERNRRPTENVPERKAEEPSPNRSEKNDFTEFAKVVYHRLKIYRGIYIFYSIITFMLGLPVMVTGFKKQFFSDDRAQKILHCPHYLGIVSILSCCISLWTAMKNQIVICVLTLLTGIITVISAMIVLVTSALDLSATPINETFVISEHDEHLNQQTHVVFIFSIGLLIASLAIVITTLSHLSARRVKHPKSRPPDNQSKQQASNDMTDDDDDEIYIMHKDNNHRYSFASTISSLIKQELKDNISHESRERLKKTLSCPSDPNKKSNSDLTLDVIVHTRHRGSTHSLPEGTENYNDEVLDRWRRASFLARHQNQIDEDV